LIDLAVLDKVQSYIEDALASGTLLLMGGKVHQRGGLFFEPTILTNVTQSKLVAREETFGPVVRLFHCHTGEEAIAIANTSEFGLAAYFYARDIGRVLWVAGA
jgi:succinate-semialdehyde dehydrogenase/glutarate-semialdehyde dehydrogenase